MRRVVRLVVGFRGAGEGEGRREEEGVFFSDDMMVGWTKRGGKGELEIWADGHSRRRARRFDRLPPLTSERQGSRSTNREEVFTL